MIISRKSEDRGATKLDWLDSKHTFSFGQYNDSNFMGFGALRVINEDKVLPNSGFGTHSHKDMEIITYVIEGILEHKDSLGTGSLIKPGEIQRMSAGQGIFHSEYNPSESHSVHFLQIWVIPNKIGLLPSYEQKTFNDKRMPGVLTLIASEDGEANSVKIHQDFRLYVLNLKAAQSFTYNVAEKRMIWLQVVKGNIQLFGQNLASGDGMAITQNKFLEMTAFDETEILFFDLVDNNISAQ